MMQEVFEKLRVLQEILSQKYEIEKEIQEIPKVFSTKTELLNRLKKSYIEKNTKIGETKKKISATRQFLIDAEAKRENLEKQMDAIKTQREYETLDKEIKDAAENEQQFRKDILHEEKDLEEMLHSFEREEAMIKEQEEELRLEKERIESESHEKRHTLQELEDQEKKISPGLNEDILFKFERIIHSKSGLGIVPVKNSVCSGCHMFLPAQFENDVRKGTTIHFCPYCSRILYFEEDDMPMESPMAAFSEEDFGHFADFSEKD